MVLLGYNRRLAWVVIPLVLWSLLGLTLAIGAERRGMAPLQVQLGLPSGSYIVRGRALRIAENDAKLTVTIAVPPGVPREIRNGAGQPIKLPEDLAVEFVTPPRIPAGPPEVQLESGRDRPHLERGGRSAVLTKRYIVHCGPEEVWIIPRGLIPLERLHEILRRDRELRPPGPPPGPPAPSGQPPEDRRRRERWEERPPEPSHEPGGF